MATNFATFPTQINKTSFHFSLVKNFNTMQQISAKQKNMLWIHRYRQSECSKQYKSDGVWSFINQTQHTDTIILLKVNVSSIKAKCLNTHFHIHDYHIFTTAMQQYSEYFYGNMYLTMFFSCIASLCLFFLYTAYYYNNDDNNNNDAGERNKGYVTSSDLARFSWKTYPSQKLLQT